MNRNFVLAFSMLFITTISSNVYSQNTKEENDKYEMCHSLEELAEIIISKRYSGVSMKNMIQRLNETNQLNKMNQTLIIAAFEQPNYSSTEMQQNAIENFKNRVYLMCIKAITD